LSWTTPPFIIHDAEPILDDLAALLAAAGVTPLFLPTYSPELNPCELVFGETKSYLYHRRGKDRFWREIMKSFAKVTREHMCNYYVHCILGPLLGLF
jgi:transposase